MTETSNTINPAVVAARQHERIALMAIAQHIFDHELDVPHSMAIDRSGADANSIVVSVHHESSDAWVESLAVDRRTSQPVTNTDLFGRPMLRHIVSGRLPDMGIRVTVRFYEVLPSTTAHLQVVGA